MKYTGTILQNTIYFLALINPPSKILFLSGIKECNMSGKWLFKISVKSNIFALLIISVIAIFGKFILSEVLRVEIYSLNVAGGIIMFMIGLNAIKQGAFHDKNIDAKHCDMSIVPLASPMIAGPGIMTAVMYASSTSGVSSTLFCVLFAIILNFSCMCMSGLLGKCMHKLHLAEAMIRITGLIVSSVAIQMIFNGISVYQLLK